MGFWLDVGCIFEQPRPVQSGEAQTQSLAEIRRQRARRARGWPVFRNSIRQPRRVPGVSATLQQWPVESWTLCDSKSTRDNQSGTLFALRPLTKGPGLSLEACHWCFHPMGPFLGRAPENMELHLMLRVVVLYLPLCLVGLEGI